MLIDNCVNNSIVKKKIELKNPNAEFVLVSGSDQVIVTNEDGTAVDGEWVQFLANRLEEDTSTNTLTSQGEDKSIDSIEGEINRKINMPEPTNIFNIKCIWF